MLWRPSGEALRPSEKESRSKPPRKNPFPSRLPPAPGGQMTKTTTRFFGRDGKMIRRRSRRGRAPPSSNSGVMELQMSVFNTSEQAWITLELAAACAENLEARKKATLPEEATAELARLRRELVRGPEDVQRLRRIFSGER